MSHIGYLAVVVPEIDFWQGYFIDDAFRDKANDTIRNVRDYDLLRTGSKVLKNLTNISDQDQPLVGGFCGSIVEAALGRIGPLDGLHRQRPSASAADGVIAVLGYALHQLMGERFFYIEGNVGTEGTLTKITPIRASSIEQAREIILSLPSVAAIKQRLVQSLFTAKRH